MSSPAASGSAPIPVGLIARAGAAFFPIEFLAKLPLAMTLVGVLTLVTGTHSLAMAGLASGLLGLSSALCAPLLGAAADRWGQRRTLLPVAVLNGSALVGLLTAAQGHAHPAILLSTAVLTGASSPQIGPMGRARWMALVPAATHPRHLAAAMGYESMTDEITFIVGPLLVALTAGMVSPAAPLALAAAVVFGFVVAFAIHPTHAVAGRQDEAPRTSGPRRARGLGLLLAGMAVIGVFWGTSLTSLTAFGSAHGNPSMAGYVYGAMGAGAAISALGVGLLPGSIGARSRLLIGAGVVTAGAAPLAAIDAPALLALCFLVVGLGIGPILVTLFSLAAEGSPRNRTATTMTLLNSAMVLGQAAATTGNAAVVGSFGPATGFLALAGVGIVLLLLGAARPSTAGRGR